MSKTKQREGLRLDKEGFVYFFFLTISAVAASFIFLYLVKGGGRGIIEHLFLFYLLFIFSIPAVVGSIIGFLLYIIASSIAFLPSELVEYGFFFILAVCAVIHFFMMSTLIAAARKEFRTYHETLSTYVGLMVLFGFLIWYMGFFAL